MILSLFLFAPAVTSLATRVMPTPSEDLPQLTAREVEVNQFANIQINTYNSTDCTGEFNMWNGQYNAKYPVGDTQSFYITRDLINQGEAINFYAHSDCTPSNLDKPQLLSQSHCISLQNINHCFQLLYTASGAPAAATPGINEATCSVKYTGMDEFTVRGKNFDAGKAGFGGSGIRTALSKCSGFKKWWFVQTPTDPTYQWEATFTANVGTKKCVGNAIKAAGGSSDGGCHGAG